MRLGITFLTMLIIYTIIKGTSTYRNDVEDSTLILIVVGIVAFTISCFFVSVYSDSIEAIYITYLVDKERGSHNENCPPELNDFLVDADNNQKEYEEAKRQKELQQQQQQAPPAYEPLPPNEGHP